MTTKPLCPDCGKPAYGADHHYLARCAPESRAFRDAPVVAPVERKPFAVRLMDKPQKSNVVVDSTEKSNVPPLKSNRGGKRVGAGRRKKEGR